MSPQAKWAIGGAIGGGALAGLLATGSSALAVYFARRIITPARQRTADQEVLAVIRDGQDQRVIFAATDDTTVDGVYGFFFDGGKGHARIGRIVSYSPAEQTVMREVEAVYSGDLTAARWGWWSGTVAPDPAAVGIPAEDVLIEVERGQAPAWLVRAGGTTDVTAWAQPSGATSKPPSTTPLPTGRRRWCCSVGPWAAPFASRPPTCPGTAT